MHSPQHIPVYIYIYINLKRIYCQRSGMKRGNDDHHSELQGIIMIATQHFCG